MNKRSQIDNEDYLKSQWKIFIMSQLKLACFGGVLIIVLSVILTNFRFDLIGPFILIGIMASFGIFLILSIFEIVPNYIFFRKRLRRGEEEFLVENVRQYGVSKLAHAMWFIWPREL